MIDRSLKASVNISEVIADLQFKIFAFRKKIFKQALKSNIPFQNAVASYEKEFGDAITMFFKNSLDQSEKIITDEIQKNYKNGIKASDKALEHYKKQGLKIELKETQLNEQRPQQITNKILTSLLSVFTVVFATQMQDFKTIPFLVNNEADNMLAEIDKAQTMSLKKGITGKILSNGTEKSAVAEIEYLLRNETHHALIQGEADRLQEVGFQPLVQVSAHPNSCKLCAPWELRILIDNVYQDGQPDGKHELLSTAIEGGLFHWNCRHNLIPYVAEFDKPDLFEKDKMTAKETAKGYAFEQRQREIERSIREWKTREAGSLSEVERQNASKKVKEWQALQRALINQAERENVIITRQYSREQIGGGTTPRLPQR